jgi:hypothetical protein
MKFEIEKKKLEELIEKKRLQITPYLQNNFSVNGYPLHAIAIHRHFTDGKVEKIHDFKEEPDSFILIINDYVLLEVQEKVIINDDSVRAKFKPEFGLVLGGMAFFAPELNAQFSYPSGYFDKKPESGTLLLGVKNMMERDLIIDPYQLVGFLRFRGHKEHGTIQLSE